MKLGVEKNLDEQTTRRIKTEASLDENKVN
jgi:hypothetical protein